MQAIAIRELASGVSRTEAVRRAGYSESVIRVPGSVLDTPVVENALKPVMIRYNITLERAIAPISEALDATLKVPIEGDFYDTGISDIKTRLAGSDRALKLLNIKPEGDGVPFDGRAFTEAMQEGDEVKLTQLLFKRSP